MTQCILCICAENDIYRETLTSTDRTMAGIPKMREVMLRKKEMMVTTRDMTR